MVYYDSELANWCLQDNFFHDSDGQFLSAEIHNLGYWSVCREGELVTIESLRIPESLSATNYPNPFNPSTVISYNLPESGFVEILIFNLLGQKIKTLKNEEENYGYNKKVIWDGTDKNGKSVPTGIYFYQIKAGKYKVVGKMLLTK